MKNYFTTDRGTLGTLSSEAFILGHEFNTNFERAYDIRQDFDRSDTAPIPVRVSHIESECYWNYRNKSSTYDLALPGDAGKVCLRTLLPPNSHFSVDGKPVRTGEWCSMKSDKVATLEFEFDRYRDGQDIEIEVAYKNHHYIIRLIPRRLWPFSAWLLFAGCLVFGFVMGRCKKI